MGCNATKKPGNVKKLNPTKPNKTMRSDACSHNPHLLL